MFEPSSPPVPPRSAVLALPALRHIPERSRRNNRRMFNEQNASVQDREMVITNVLDNEPVQHSEMVITNVLDNYEPVTDAVPLTFAYPEGIGGRGPRCHGAGDRSRGGRGEYQGSTSSENSHGHSTFAGIYLGNQPIQVQPSSGTNVMDDDEVNETDEQYRM